MKSINTTHARQHCRTILLIALALPLTAVLGCPTEEYDEEVALYATTGPPPSMIASIENRENVERIELSKGVVLGARCWESDYENDCGGVDIIVNPPGLLDVRSAYLLRGDAYKDWVLIGKEKGSGSLTIATPKATKVYPLVVHAPPVSE